MDKLVILFFLLLICWNIDATLDSYSYKRIYARLKRQTNVCEASNSVLNKDGSVIFNVRFPKAKVTHDDAYLCTSQKVPFNGKESYITKYLPHADMTSTHHMLVYGCEMPGSTEAVWVCGSMGNICSGHRSEIIYAWAKNAPALTLPSDIGYRIGGSSKLNYVVVQMHYSHKLPLGKFDCSGFSAVVTQQPQKFYAGIFLLGASYIKVPPHSNSSADVSCRDSVESPLRVFAFRTHAHSTGKVITGYRVRNGAVTMIGKGNPQWPHAFYPRVGGPIELKNGDSLLARCRYESNRDKTTHSGGSGSDEMCNFYMMYYTTNKDVPGRGLSCWGNQLRIGPNNFPPDANDLAPYPGFAGADSIKAIESGEAIQPSDPGEHHHHHGNDHDIDRSTGSSEKGIHFYPELTAELDWPNKTVEDRIGQVGGVSVDSHGFVHVFHRADRLWDFSSFDVTNHFIQSNKPISSNTMFVMDPIQGKIFHEWGKDMFFMPHGVTIDGRNYVWVTDVAMHQVMKFSLYGDKVPLLTLGEKMRPGSDSNHFCKPTKVAVDKDGTFYVADGYCNGRVVKFSPNGDFIKSWGQVGLSSREGNAPPFHFAVAHSITLAGDKMQYVCVADRENGRIQCFTKDGGFVKIIQHKKKMGEKVYAISYNSRSGGLLYVINGPSSAAVRSSVFAIQFDSGDVIGQWTPTSSLDLSHPHDVAAPHDQDQVFVGQLEGQRLYEFKVTYKNSSLVTAKSSQRVNQRRRPEVTRGETSLLAEYSGVSKKGKNVPSEQHPTSVLQHNKAQHPSSDLHPPNTDVAPTEIVEHSDDGNWNILLAVLLIAVPVLCVIIGILLVRAQKKKYRSYQDLLKEESFDGYHDDQFQKQKNKFNVGTFLSKSNPHKQGFEPVKTIMSDQSESEDELYSNTMNR